MYYQEYKCAFDSNRYKREFDSIDPNDQSRLKDLNLKILDQIEQLS